MKTKTTKYVVQELLFDEGWIDHSERCKLKDARIDMGDLKVLNPDIRILKRTVIVDEVIVS